MKKRRRRRKKRGCSKYISVVAILTGFMGYFGGKEVVKVVQDLTTEIPYAEITMDTSELDQKYYYESLPENEQLAYQEILQGIEDNQEEIYVHSEDAKRTNKIFEYVLKDFPDIFWCDGTASTTLYESQEKYTVLNPVYLCDGENKAKRKEIIEETADEFLQTVPEDATDYEKILAVYEYVIDTVDYDMKALDNQNIYSVFANKKSVCAGYSKATQYLLERLDVFCIYVTGTTYENQSHAWNIVKCEDDYYYVDTTWGDPIFQETDQEKTDEQIERISYDFLCCNEEQLQNTHTPDDDVELPVCEKMDQNYYVQNDMYFTSYDSQIILQKIKDVIATGENPSVLKFASQELYQEAQEDIFGNLIKEAAQSLGAQYGLSTVHYQYMDDSMLNKITIYWQYE